MKSLRRKALTAAMLAAVCAGSVVTISAGTARADATPPWENSGNPTLFDPNDVGTLLFYNSAGQQIRGGHVSDSPIAAYVQGTTVLDPADSKATLLARLPVSGQNAGIFSGEGLSLSTTYPVSAPAGLASSNLPVVTGHSSDESLYQFEQDFPNTDTSATDGYGYVFQLRLISSNPNLTKTYDAADIAVTGYGADATWTVIYPATAATSTATTLAVSPASPQPFGTPVTLTSTTTASGSPVSEGQVQFFDGTTALGPAGPVAADGTATLNTTTLALGTHQLNAVYTDTGPNFATSTSADQSFVIGQTTTSTGLTISPASPQPYGANLTFQAKVTPPAAGTVQFENGSGALGAPVAVDANGVATLVTTLPVGTYTSALGAVFTPTDAIDYTGSSATPASYVITTYPLVTNTTAPTITGSAAVGDILTAQPGSWTAGATLVYQWLADGSPIAGATGTSLLLGPAEYNKQVSVQVLGYEVGFVTLGPATSAPTARVGPGTLSGPVPTITGTTRVGFTLAAHPGAWTAGTTLHYQWYASGGAVAGATLATLTLGPVEYGKTVTVRVTGTKTDYTTRGITSAATARIGPGILSGPVPTITGTTRVGFTLAAHPGVWTAGTTLHYQWYASGVPIAGATRTTLLLTGAQRGRTISVRVTGTKPDYTSLVRTSAATRAVTS